MAAHGRDLDGGSSCGPVPGGISAECWVGSSLGPNISPRAGVSCVCQDGQKLEE